MSSVLKPGLHKFYRVVIRLPGVDAEGNTLYRDIFNDPQPTDPDWFALRPDAFPPLLPGQPSGVDQLRSAASESGPCYAQTGYRGFLRAADAHDAAMRMGIRYGDKYYFSVARTVLAVDVEIED